LFPRGPAKGSATTASKPEPGEARLQPPDLIPAAFPVGPFHSWRALKVCVHGFPIGGVCATLTAMPDAEPLTPRPNPPDETHRSRATINIGGRRYEVVYCLESRMIERGPAEVIEMPGPFVNAPGQMQESTASAPRVDAKPAAASGEPRRAMRNVGGRRFELTCRTEAREIKRKPAKVVQMPDSVSGPAAEKPASNRRPR